LPWKGWGDRGRFVIASYYTDMQQVLCSELDEHSNFVSALIIKHYYSFRLHNYSPSLQVNRLSLLIDGIVVFAYRPTFANECKWLILQVTQLRFVYVVGRGRDVRGRGRREEGRTPYC
jgi:hypothetical protein